MPFSDRMGRGCNQEMEGGHAPSTAARPRGMLCRVPDSRSGRDRPRDAPVAGAVGSAGCESARPFQGRRAPLPFPPPRGGRGPAIHSPIVVRCLREVGSALPRKRGIAASLPPHPGSLSRSDPPFKREGEVACKGEGEVTSIGVASTRGHALRAASLRSGSRPPIRSEAGHCDARVADAVG
jgi:hypothetical protein